MGILGLLKVLRGVTSEFHMRQYKGQAVGVDISCWLHRGSYACAHELVEGILTTKHVTFCMKMLRMLISNGVIPVVVFDGRPLPAKHATNAARVDSRQEHAYLARQAVQAGQGEVAQKHFQQAVSITPAMTLQLIDVLDTEGIQYIVAPYESDAMLAYLSHHDFVDAVLTEDSDALTYGCKDVLFKVNAQGEGEHIQLTDVFTPSAHLLPTTDCDFRGWSVEQFQLFCCVAGCDYAPKVKNLGIKSAYKLVSKHKTIRTLLTALQETTSFGRVDAAYAAQLHRAWLTFKHQTIYNPASQQMEHLTPLPAHYSLHISTNTAERHPTGTGLSGADFAFLGEWINESGVPALIARGVIDPLSLVARRAPAAPMHVCDSVVDSLWGFDVEDPAPPTDTPRAHPTGTVQSSGPVLTGGVVVRAPTSFHSVNVARKFESLTRRNKRKHGHTCITTRPSSGHTSESAPHGLVMDAATGMHIGPDGGARGPGDDPFFTHMLVDGPVTDTHDLYMPWSMPSAHVPQFHHKTDAESAYYEATSEWQDPTMRPRGQANIGSVQATGIWSGLETAGTITSMESGHPCSSARTSIWRPDDMHTSYVRLAMHAP